MVLYTIARPQVHELCRALRGVSSVVISLFFSLSQYGESSFSGFFPLRNSNFTFPRRRILSLHNLYVEHIPILYTIGVTLLRHPETNTYSKLQTSHFIYTLTLILSQQKLI